MDIIRLKEVEDDRLNGTDPIGYIENIFFTGILLELYINL